LRVGAGPRWVRGDVRGVEGAVDDQLAATLKQVEKAHRAVRAVEAVLLLHRHPRHPAALGGQRIAGAGQLLLLDQQLLTGGIPLLRRHDRRSLHRGLSSLRYSATTSNRRPHRCACAPSSPLLRSARRAGARAVGSGPELTPQHAGLLEPHRCFEIAGWDCRFNAQSGPGPDDTYALTSEADLSLLPQAQALDEAQRSDAERARTQAEKWVGGLTALLG